MAQSPLLNHTADVEYKLRLQRAYVPKLNIEKYERFLSRSLTPQAVSSEDG